MSALHGSPLTAASGTARDVAGAGPALVPVDHPAAATGAGDGFLPHGQCLLWDPDILALHLGSDALIAAAYFSIPFALVHFVRRRTDLRFRRVFQMFAAFIVACGATHLMGVWTLWQPDYLAEGIVKAVTAAVSLATAVLLWPIVPRALALPSPARLAEANDSLRREVAERERAEAALRQVQASLEARVEARTEDLARANERLREHTEALELSNRELDDFAYVASHDLREPLRGIHNYATFLVEDHGDRLGDDGREKLETLQRLSARMDDLINALLHYSRVGRVELATRETDLQALLDDVLDSLSISIAEANVVVDVPRPLPRVVCDGVRVAEVLRNLVGNAIKYNDKAEKRVEIGWTDTPAGPEIRVRDNGIGIPERHRAAVFQIFKRLHGRDRYGGGTGAGLTIVKRIVERHGGRIEIDSTPGEGSLFRFTLAPGPAPAGEG